jgi:hypothetical protein
LATGTTVDPAGAGVLDDAVDGTAGDGVLAPGMGAGVALGVDVPPAEPRAFGEPCSSWEDGEAVKIRMAAMAAMAARSTDAETINVRRLWAVIQHLEIYGLRNRC